MGRAYVLFILTAGNILCKLLVLVYLWQAKSCTFPVLLQAWCLLLFRFILQRSVDLPMLLILDEIDGLLQILLLESWHFEHIIIHWIIQQQPLWLYVRDHFRWLDQLHVVVVAVYPLVIIAFPCDDISRMEHFVFFLAAHGVVFVFLGALNLVLFTGLTGRTGYGGVWKR